jgi:hypothetical protein
MMVLATVKSVALIIRGRRVPSAGVEVNSRIDVSLSSQTIISLPVHTTLWPIRPAGALLALVADQLSADGLYFPQLFK